MAAVPGPAEANDTSAIDNGSSGAEAQMDEDDEEAQLAAALALSQGDDVVMADEEEDEIQRAIRLSNTDANDESGKK